MAVKKTQVHGFKRIQSDLKQDVNGVMLFYGREDYLIRWSVDQIKDKYINPAVEMFDFVKFDGSEVSAGIVIEACETMPMMSEKRVVLVEDFDMAREDAGELAEYFAEFPESTVLILVCKVPDKRLKLFKAVKKYGSEYEFGILDNSLLKSFIIKRLRNEGKKFESDVPDILSELSGYYDKDSDYTIDNLINDIAKIVSHSGDVITVQDVESTVASNEERDAFAFASAVAEGKKNDALRLLGVLLSYGENTFKILGLICSQFETMLLINEMRADGFTQAQMHARLGIHEYRIKKTAPMAARYSSGKLRDILMKAYTVDREIKTGLIEPELALELFVSRV
ncbi:MAG: DNA polymerase III subunit delta [Firmicutes bacterium]|nr:DNA polymerase III subunit delta [Bacillota bacterium]